MCSKESPTFPSYSASMVVESNRRLSRPAGNHGKCVVPPSEIVVMGPLVPVFNVCSAVRPGAAHRSGSPLAFSPMWVLPPSSVFASIGGNFSSQVETAGLGHDYRALSGGSNLLRCGPRAAQQAESRAIRVVRGRPGYLGRYLVPIDTPSNTSLICATFPQTTR